MSAAMVFFGNVYSADIRSTVVDEQELAVIAERKKSLQKGMEAADNAAGSPEIVPEIVRQVHGTQCVHQRQDLDAPSCCSHEMLSELSSCLVVLDNIHLE